jgi:serine/tyrosine/threonine adenylyltransferase
MTLFFRCLMRLPLGNHQENAHDTDSGANNAKDVDQMEDRELAELFRPAFYDEHQAFTHAPLSRLAGWLRRYIARVRREEQSEEARIQRMRRANPKYVLRNYMAQQAIEALEQDDASVINRLMKVLEHPYDEQPEHEDLAARRPEWARNKAGCSALSCSS